MIRHRSSSLYLILVVLFLLSFSILSGQFGGKVLAENVGEVVAVESPVPTQPPPTNTPTEEPTKEPTVPPPPTSTPEPLPPAEIPEPITVILFGTGLAALSAAAARRKKAE